MSSTSRTATKEAIWLTKLLDALHLAHGVPRYPVNVEQLALQCAEQYRWNDPIAQVSDADIPGFVGGLFKDSDKNRWLLLYNPKIGSPGRIRFTQAHELGHYILHRQLQDMFQCSAEDMLNWDPDEKDIESQADRFASHLLMPLHDYREQVSDTVDLDVLGHCANRYGVSLSAAILKWLDHTDQKAVLIHSRDGYMNWSWSSHPAWKAGAFFKTKQAPVPLPYGSLALDDSIAQEKKGQSVPARIWFEHADKELPLREMKLTSERYDVVLTLLVLPKFCDVWKPRY